MSIIPSSFCFSYFLILFPFSFIFFLFLRFLSLFPFSFLLIFFPFSFLITLSIHQDTSSTYLYLSASGAPPPASSIYARRLPPVVSHPPPPGLRGVSCRRSVGPSGLRDSTPPSAASIVSSLAALLDPVGGDLLLPTRECVVLVLAAIASSEVVCRTADSWHRSPAPVVSHLCRQPPTPSCRGPSISPRLCRHHPSPPRLRRRPLAPPPSFSTSTLAPPHL